MKEQLLREKESNLQNQQFIRPSTDTDTNTITITMPSWNFYQDNVDDDEVEVVFRDGKVRPKNGDIKNPSPNQSQNSDYSVDLEQSVFDAFGYQNDDVTEFFDYDRKESPEDMENPNKIYNDPKEDAV